MPALFRLVLKLAMCFQIIALTVVSARCAATEDRSDPGAIMGWFLSMIFIVLTAYLMGYWHAAGF
jgi:hypothetical protein